MAEIVNRFVKPIKKNQLIRKTSRLLIRPLQMRDDRAWYASNCAALPNPSTWEIKRYRLKELSFDLFMTHLNQQAEEILKGLRITLGIFHKDTGTLIGYIYRSDYK